MLNFDVGAVATSEWKFIRAVIFSRQLILKLISRRGLTPANLFHYANPRFESPGGCSISSSTLRVETNDAPFRTILLREIDRILRDNFSHLSLSVSLSSLSFFFFFSLSLFSYLSAHDISARSLDFVRKNAFFYISWSDSTYVATSTWRLEKSRANVNMIETGAFSILQDPHSRVRHLPFLALVACQERERE